MIVRQDIAKSLEYGARARFLQGQQGWPSKRGLIAVEAPMGTGKKETYVGIGAHPYPLQGVDRVQPRGLLERYIEIEPLDWELTLAIEHNAINDDRVGHVLPWMMGAGQGFEAHLEQRCFAALNGGDGSTYGLCYDGNEFFDTQHADSGADYITVQSNLQTLELNLDNFNTVWVAAKKFLNDRGNNVNIPFNLLTVPPDRRAIAAQICDNAQAYDTANREINPYSADFTYVVSPEFDATAWALSSTILPDKPIIIQMRQAPEMVIWDDENVAKGGGVRFMKWHARYEIGYGNWRLAFLGKT